MQLSMLTSHNKSPACGIEHVHYMARMDDSFSERVDQVPPKEQRELQLKTGMVAKDKLEANLTTHPHNAVLCEQLSLT